MFEISFSKQEWLKILTAIVGITDRKQVIPTLSFILVQQKGKQLFFTGSDLETEITVKVNHESEVNPFSFLLPGKIFYDICNLSSDSQITLKVNDDRKISVNAQTSKYQLIGLDPKDFPKYREEQSNYLWQINLLGKQIKKLVKKTAFAADEQNVRHYLNGLMFTLDQQQIRVITTDSHRLAFAKEELSKRVDSQNFILPKKAAAELHRIFTNEENILVEATDTYLKLSTESLTVYTKLIGGKFPDYYQIIFGAKGEQIKLNTALLMQAINKVGILVDDKLKLIKLSFLKQQLVVDSDTENQEANDVLPLDYDREPVEILLNLEYLRETLRQIEAEEVQISFKDAKQAVIFEPVGDCSVIYIIMPVVR